MPGLESLTPRFVDAGVVSEECLHDLALMPLQQQNVLLKDDMRLTVFDCRIIRCGLAELVG